MNRRKTDRHGIVQLGTDEDLAAHFLGENGRETPNQEFAQLIEAALDTDRLRQAAAEKARAENPRKPEPPSAAVRRYPRPQEDIDLHHLTAAEAQSRVRYAVADAALRGLRTVRIITGKGLHSETGAVLREVVEQTLVTLKRGGRILTFAWERGAKARSGAVIVYLPEQKQHARRDR